MNSHRKTAFGLIIILCFIWIAPVWAQSGLVTSTTTEVWLRTGPGVEWRKLDILPVGTTIALDGHDPSGLWVRGITSGGAVGWIASRYVTASSDAIFSLPSIWVDAPFELLTVQSISNAAPKCESKL